ncbi:MAG: DUF1704 domain-containing protein [Pseudomonadales bacterium]|jgi:hypothetical protein|nr:DUF1704 domain-containing protein [Pseudomonadales bacterium]
MMKASDLTPLNLDEEKARFFADQTYNPQFKYRKPIDSEFETFLTRYGFPDEEIGQFLEQKLADERYVSSPEDEDFLSREEVVGQVDNLSERLGLEKIEVVFDENQLTGAKVSYRPSQISFKAQPIRRAFLPKTLNHEIQTHYLRSYNQRHLCQKTLSFPTRLFTEEGLAVINGNFALRRLSLTKIMLHYLGVYYASKYGFAQTFAKLRQYYQSDLFTWKATLRYKRGLEDTSQPGGFTKDKAYLEGVVLVANWLGDPNNDPRLLYGGKYDLINPVDNNCDIDGLKYPTFYDDLEAYRQFVRELVEVNNLNFLYSELEPYFASLKQ